MKAVISIFLKKHQRRGSFTIDSPLNRYWPIKEMLRI
jgi:hypothetical protein